VGALFNTFVPMWLAEELDDRALTAQQLFERMVGVDRFVHRHRGFFGVPSDAGKYWERTEAMRKEGVELVRVMVR
jgi:hypothetical protein